MALDNIKKEAEQEAEDLEKGFDEAVEAKKSKTAKIEILGKTFEIPKAMPGWVNFFIGKYGTGKNKDVPPERYLEFMVRVCGDEIVDHIIDNAPNDMDSAEIEKETVRKIEKIWAGDTKKKK